MEITIKAKDYSQCRHILIKYYDKVAGYIIKRPDSNLFDCFDCTDIIPKQESIDYLKPLKKYLSMVDKIYHPSK